MDNGNTFVLLCVHSLLKCSYCHGPACCHGYTLSTCIEQELTQEGYSPEEAHFMAKYISAGSVNVTLEWNKRVS